MDDKKVIILDSPRVSREEIEASLTATDKSIIVNNEEQMSTINNYVAISSFANGIEQATFSSNIAKSVKVEDNPAAFGMRYSNSRKAKTRRIKNKKRK